jgi:hypothetical protein
VSQTWENRVYLDNCLPGTGPESSDTLGQDYFFFEEVAGPDSSL